jgi:hypothetical protein
MFLLSFPYILSEHNRLRSAGYLAGFLSVKFVLWPLFVSVSGALATTSLYAFVSDSSSSMSKTSLLQLLVSVQNAILLFVVFRYLYACMRHNLSHAPPEVGDLDRSRISSVDTQRVPAGRSINSDLALSPSSPYTSSTYTASPSHSSTVRKQSHMIGYVMTFVVLFMYLCEQACVSCHIDRSPARCGMSRF